MKLAAGALLVLTFGRCRLAQTASPAVTAAVRAALARRNITYEPSVVEMWGRAWPPYRQPVTTAWAPYYEGRVTMDAAIANTAASLPAPR